MSFRNRIAVGVLALATVISVAACGNGTPSSSPSSSNSSSSSSSSSNAVQSDSAGKAGTNLPGTPAAIIKSSDTLQWTPATVTVKAGQVIEFTNPSSNSITHNVTIANHSALSTTSQGLYPGAKWFVEFTTPGTYPFSCTIHPGMTGTITVTAS
ncbi:MAG: cupredoxin domain-containing protein [Candidatus Dormibacteria bacterium]